MTVQELYDKLGIEIECGHGDLRVIANCDFRIKTFREGFEWKEHFDGFYLTHLNDVYYQSGDIEIAFSDKEEL